MEYTMVSKRGLLKKIEKKNVWCLVKLFCKLDSQHAVLKKLHFKVEIIIIYIKA